MHPNELKPTTEQLSKEMHKKLGYLNNSIVENYVHIMKFSCTLKWALLMHNINFAVRMKGGPRERAKFAQNVPHIWELIHVMGEPEQIEWVKKRLQRYAKDTGIEMPDLESKPKGFTDMLADMVGEKKDAEHEAEGERLSGVEEAPKAKHVVSGTGDEEQACIGS